MIPKSVTVTAVEDVLQKHRIQYYPNPTADKLFLNHSSYWIGGEIGLRDSSGRLLIAKKISEGITEMNVEELDSGVFTVVLNKANKYYLFKIVKR